MFIEIGIGMYQNCVARHRCKTLTFDIGQLLLEFCAFPLCATCRTNQWNLFPLANQPIRACISDITHDINLGHFSPSQSGREEASRERESKRPPTSMGKPDANGNYDKWNFTSYHTSWNCDVINGVHIQGDPSGCSKLSVDVKFHRSQISYCPCKSRPRVTPIE